MAQRYTALLAAFIILLLQWQVATAEEALCAQVKIEILQGITLERQAFEATMRITNSLDLYAIEDIQVDINFKDEDDNDVLASSDSAASNATFFIRLDYDDGLEELATGANGAVVDGRISPNTVGEMRWLIIPTPGASGDLPTGKLYFVGATLNYKFGGKEERVEVAPDTIIVKPQPVLTLDYFLTEEVYGDDAFTKDIVEPVVPYSLGIRLANNGKGEAKSVTIDSAEPKIVENEMGLLIGFKITGSYVNDESAEPSLKMNFGDIAAGDRTVGRWIMETTLSGKFIEFGATVSHAAEYGGELTSLIEAANTHFLVKDVQVDLPGRDSVNDFLAHNGGDTDTPALWVYESEPLGVKTAACDDCAEVTRISATLGAEQNQVDGKHRLLTAAETIPGFGYIKVADPYQGSKVLSKAVRADGSVLQANNAWLSQERNADLINFDYFIHIFDDNPTSTYDLVFDELASVPQPPVIAYINDKTTYEGGQVGFLIRTSDPNRTTPTLTVNQLPLGAHFEYDNQGKGIFRWFPQLGQAGVYPVTFTASDGQLNTSLTVTIKVNPATDTDGDGLLDEWELDNFGDLSRDGTGDFDGDGYTDLEEFERGWNPKEAAKAPDVPQIDSPAFGAETSTLEPELIIQNSRHADELVVTYQYEVYADEGMTDLVFSIADVEEDYEKTTQVMQAGLVQQAVNDNAWYYWRVRGVAPEGTGEWAYGKFFINTQNDLPTVPAISAPANDSQLSELQPTLSVTNSFDIDNDELTYRFVVYPEGDDANPVAEISGLAAGDNGHTDWQVPVELVENQRYQWQVEVTDEHEAKVSSAVAGFMINLANDAPSAPVVVLPVDQQEVNQAAVTLVVNNGEDPDYQSLSYFFELDEVNTFDSGARILSGEVLEGANAATGQTAFTFDQLIENKTYFWRVKASDGELDSDWVQASFTVNAVNEAPTVPTVSNPGNDATVEVIQPTLSLNPATDVDNDSLSYEIELYADLALTQGVVSAVVSDQSWQVTTSLPDNNFYYWRARAIDEHGLASDWSTVSRFFVNKDGYNDSPQLTMVLPNQNLELTDGEVLIQWTDTDPDSDAKITLSYLGDNGESGVIAENISEDLDGTSDQFSWNITDLPVGNYTITAGIEDEASFFSVDACCTVSVVPLEGHILPTLVSTTNEVDEYGKTLAQVDVVLDRAPYNGAKVTVNVSVSDSSEIKINRIEQAGQVVASNYLYFTEDDWDVPRSIFIEGMDDCDVDGNQTASLVLSAAVSDDSGFDQVDPQDISIVNVDNEDPDKTLFVCDYSVVDQASNGSTQSLTLRARLKNIGGAVPNALGTVSVVSGSMTLRDSNQLYFPTVATGAKVESIDTFVVEYPTTSSFDPSKLQWDIDAGSVGGNGLPEGWSAKDIGLPFAGGSTSYDGSFHVKGSAGDIWGISDVFHFTYRTLRGDGEIVAKINRLDHSHDWAKAGVMIRASDWIGAKHAFMLMTPKQGVDFQYRSTSNWVTYDTGLKAASMGTWLRLVRVGDTLTGYISNDAYNWVRVGSVNIGMDNDVLVGLAASSNKSFSTTQSSFSDVWVEEYQ
ncbi:putative Ig domain-containing protein [Litoribrevibacter euphylliae]|uniref:Ig domain-containing protein n=1 Tax=Litoribrevibacter euphylliae TaxID=1834034 RepID=A0ABV7H9M5_9GAMM